MVTGNCTSLILVLWRGVSLHVSIAYGIVIMCYTHNTTVGTGILFLHRRFRIPYEAFLDLVRECKNSSYL